MKIISKYIFTLIFCFMGYAHLHAQKITSSNSSQTLTMNDNKAQSFVDSLMAIMTLGEKIGQLNLLTPGGAVTGSVVSSGVEEKIKAGNVGGIFGIRGASKVKQAQALAVDNSRLGIPLIVGMDVIHGHRTIFPIPLGLSCSWDLDLIEKSAVIAAKEATADGICWNFSPMVDIARDPRWGRIAEGAGEDPFLGSAISRAMVRGYQQGNMNGSETMMSTVKHFANYGAPEGGRDYGTADMSRLRMINYYFPPYKAAVDEGVGCVMTAFNVIDFVPASANKWLFTDVLRKKWGFDGFVVTDYTAINEMIPHGIGDSAAIAAQALKAGIDMDMVGEAFLKTLETNLNNNKISESDINTACKRVLMAKYKLGLFEDPYRYCDESRADDIFNKEHRNFARKAAGESFVLLKNDKKFLPLDRNKKIALIGPLADSRINMHGTWSVSGDTKTAVTILEGMKEAIGENGSITYAKGANITDDSLFAKRINAFKQEVVIDKRDPQVMIAEAVEVAKNSDVIVAVMGESANMSGEASSLAHIGLQPSQKLLLKALRNLDKPIILVLVNGRPMTIVFEDAIMDAVLDVWFGGTEGGHAVADVLFGDVNPSGKLTTSFPVHVGQIPVYHSMLNTGRPDVGSKRSKFKSNYLDIPNEPLYPFGYGLSYSTFEYGKPLLSSTSLYKNGELTATIQISNTSQRDGKEIIQFYIQDPSASISRPLKELKGFEKVLIKAGETKTVSFMINKEMLGFYDDQLNYKVEPGKFNVFIGSSSDKTQMLSFDLK